MEFCEKWADQGKTVRRYRFTLVETRVERAWFRRLTLKYDEPLSNFAFNFNLRRYKTVIVAALDGTFQRQAFGHVLGLVPLAGRCRLTPG